MSAERHILPSWARGLSARLLVMTVAFVMLARRYRPVVSVVGG